MKDIVLVTGTWGTKEANNWHNISSPWVKQMEQEGLQKLTNEEPFYWSSNLDGWFGDNYDWKAAGYALKWYIKAHTNKPPCIFGHSHALQVIAEAAKAGAIFDNVVTVAGPVRDGMAGAYEQLCLQSKNWMQVYSDEVDYIQWLGSMRPGLFLTPWKFKRYSKWSHIKNYIPSTSHSNLLDFNTLKVYGVFKFLRGV